MKINASAICFSLLLLLLLLLSTIHLKAQNPNYQWAFNIGTFAYNTGYSLDLDDLGNMYVTGTFAGTADFDPSGNTYNLTSNGVADIFIAKYDSAGVGGAAFAMAMNIFLFFADKESYKALLKSQ